MSMIQISNLSFSYETSGDSIFDHVSLCLHTDWKLGFSRSQFEKQMEQFSAGQKKKVLLAKSLCESAHLYLWDEPLNYLDIFSRIQLEELLLEYETTLLFIEHDSYFREKIATRIISFS